MAEDRKRATPTTPMMKPLVRIPPGWVGNYRKEHDQSNRACSCASCTLEAYPYLLRGAPVQIHPAYPTDSPQMQQMVGLYDKRAMTRIQVECSKCRGYIALEGALADSYDPNKQYICHLDCIPDEEQAHFKAVGYLLPYVIFIKRADGGGNGSVSETLPKEE